jgi:hypothetical protein
VPTRARRRLGRVASLMRAIGLVAIAMVVILVLLPAALVAAGT